MTDLDCRIQDNQAFFKNNTIVTFDFPIEKKEVVQIENIIIFVLEIPSQTHYHNNVFAFSTQGEYLWQIKFNDEQLFYRGHDCSFIGATINKEGKLVLFNWCDTAFIVNPEQERFLIVILQNKNLCKIQATSPFTMSMAIDCTTAITTYGI